ncbi:MAG: hypothetical protein KC777_07110 [Cyanobacteria bacterium HKST-UBA02]|nr:hypothetical protein [Cyanobacteria bacterium HKST-UBA02]
MSYKMDIEALRTEHPDLAEFFSGVNTLEKVFEWVRHNPDKAGEIELIPQDEFSHDMIVELTDRPGWLVAGVT